MSQYSDTLVILRHKLAVGTEGERGYIPAGPDVPAGASFAPILSRVFAGQTRHAGVLRLAAGQLASDFAEVQYWFRGNRLRDPDTGLYSGERAVEELARRFPLVYDALFPETTYTDPASGLTVTSRPGVVRYLGDTEDDL